MTTKSLTMLNSINLGSTIGTLHNAENEPILTVRSFASEAVPGTLPQGQNSPRNVRFGLYAEQMTASAFVAPRHLNKKAWLYRARPSVAHQGFVSRTSSCARSQLIVLSGGSSRQQRHRSQLPAEQCQSPPLSHTARMAPIRHP